VFCRTPREAKEAFKKAVAEGGTMIIMRLKPRFSTFLNDMIINFNFLE